MAKGRVKIEGFDQVKKNLNREIKMIKGRTLKGLIEAQIILRRSMETTSPTVPVDLRNLDHSYFCVTSTGSTPTGNSPSFEGNQASELRVDHEQVLASAKGIAMKKQRPLVVIGFSANYAAFVHEMGDDVNWSRPGSGGKFFEKALDRNKNKILQIVGKESRTK
jgi:hypothetical protein